MKIRFMSANPHKVSEVEKILELVGVQVVPVNQRIEEIQTDDVERLVHDKLIKAFEIVGRPLFVEHTGLYLEGLNGFPAGLTQIFWDKLEADRFASLVAGLDSPAVVAKTVIGFCNGRDIRMFEGQVQGRVPPNPSGSREFQWDCVFIPDGHAQTFAEMGALKNEISMRRKALDEFAAHLKSTTVNA
jgi:XTP/dITP diphosphohydrolase